ncbi:hypothetical protein AB205_0051510 [Aquarana catesbeiana]|uniref:Uncharacterized protein n=1 Tax=Aquarana catesbeiana TaxID=8400 RepID=A0A2G9RLR0_AQUCT|nr:hypothetical protein AB205_0051510 [Aquarana catesbeiana]
MRRELGVWLSCAPCVNGHMALGRRWDIAAINMCFVHICLPTTSTKSCNQQFIMYPHGKSSIKVYIVPELKRQTDTVMDVYSQCKGFSFLFRKCHFRDYSFRSTNKHNCPCTCTVN